MPQYYRYSRASKLLQNKTHITKLDLRGLKIGDESLKELAELTNLTSLDLVNNNIGNEGARALANGKLINFTLLGLSKNNIDAEGAEALASGKLVKLDLTSNDISDKGAREFIKLKDLRLDLSGNNISDQCAGGLANSIKGFAFVAKRSDLQIKPKTGIRNYITGGITIGLLLGLGTAYLAGAATLTPVGAAVAVFIAAVVVGALVDYGIGKFCEKVSEERQKDLHMSIDTAIMDVLTPECLKLQKVVHP